MNVYCIHKSALDDQPAIHPQNAHRKDKLWYEDLMHIWNGCSWPQKSELVAYYTKVVGTAIRQRFSFSWIYEPASATCSTTWDVAYDYPCIYLKHVTKGIWTASQSTLLMFIIAICVHLTLQLSCNIWKFPPFHSLASQDSTKQPVIGENTHKGLNGQHMLAFNIYLIIAGCEIAPTPFTSCSVRLQLVHC